MVALPNPVPLRRHQRLGELDPDTRRWRNVEPAQTPRHPYIKAHPTHLNAGASIKSVLFSGQTVGYVLLPIFGYALGPRATVLLFVSIFVVTAWLYWGASGSEALTEGRHAVTRRHGSKKTSRLRLRISSAPKVEPPPGKTAGNIARHLALGALFALCVSNAGSDPILVILTPLKEWSSAYAVSDRPSCMVIALLALAIMRGLYRLKQRRRPAKEAPKVCEEEIQYVPETLPPHGMRCSPRLLPAW